MREAHSAIETARRQNIPLRLPLADLWRATTACVWQQIPASFQAFAGN